MKELAYANYKNHSTTFKGNDNINSLEETTPNTNIDYIEPNNNIAETFTEPIETPELETDHLDTILENPLVATTAVAVGAEVIPLARFIKPAKDLFEGDMEKAGIGVLSRGVDMVLSLFKLGGALGSSLGSGIRGIIDNDKDFGFVKGFTQFYADWAKKRDEIEDNILGRDTKEERIRKQKEEYKKKIIEQEKLRQKLIEENKRKQEEYKVAQEKAAKERAEKELVSLGNGNRWLGYERKEFENLLQTLKEIKPYADISKYDNYKKWDSEKLEKNTKMIEREIISAKLKNTDNHQSKQSIKFENLRDYFVQLLNDYQFYKPDADISNFTNWEKWNFEKLEKNTNLLKRFVEKAKRNHSNR